ncbi:MAG TPA: hypothetical protein VNF47_28970 [Streptosporangiaceae bacterium]|nr:hypothetical protein [Streptosporangiaceae bacterium]
MAMSGGGSIIDLLGTAGRPVPMPDANSDIRSALLHRQPATRARTLIVEFPAGFCRSACGRYPAGEELLVLSGQLSLADLHLTTGAWAWLPPRFVRRNLTAEHGALVYVWFSGGNDWERCDDGDCGGPAARTTRVGLISAEPRELRGSDASACHGRSAVLAAGHLVAGAAEVLDLSNLAWTRIEADEQLVCGPGPAFVRWDEPAPRNSPADAA